MSRDFWPHIQPPQYCRGCGNVLILRLEVLADAPHFDAITGVELLPVHRQAAYCQSAREPQPEIFGVEPDLRHHDDWVLPDMGLLDVILGRATP